jgi:hypothetical protein
VNDVNSTLRQRQDHERLKGIIARIESYDVVVSCGIYLINTKHSVCTDYFLTDLGTDSPNFRYQYSSDSKLFYALLICFSPNIQIYSKDAYVYIVRLFYASHPVFSFLPCGQGHILKLTVEEL